MAFLRSGFEMKHYAAKVRWDHVCSPKKGVWVLRGLRNASASLGPLSQSRYPLGKVDSHLLYQGAMFVVHGHSK